MKFRSLVLEIFTCLLQTDRHTDRQTNRRTNDNHIWAGEIFLLFEKITSPTHYANFTSLICSVRRGIISNKGQASDALGFKVPVAQLYHMK